MGLALNNSNTRVYAMDTILDSRQMQELYIGNIQPQDCQPLEMGLLIISQILQSFSLMNDTFCLLL